MIAPAEGPLASSATRTILIVDDDRSVADTFARMLKLEGFNVATALNAEAGLELADSVRPDAIILDMRMPITNGLQFLRLVRSKPHLVEVPIAIVTGDYFLPEPLQIEIKTLGASIRFKPHVARRSDRAGEDPGSGVNDRFLRACRRQPVDVTPVWFMRQAGRYMTEYRALRQRYSLLDICRQPDLAAAVTLQPVDVIDVDAAILFSDLLLPFGPMGLEFDFVKGEGPSIAHPIRHAGDVARLHSFDPREALRHVLDTITLLRRELVHRVPLIGFAGAPFTMAAYAIEGGPSTTYARTKAFMYAQPAAWHDLCERFATMVADYLRAQVDAGVQALQVFDSWAGQLSRSDYREFAQPHTKSIFDRIADLDVPTIHFGVGTTAILQDLAEAGGHVIGVDWRLPLDEAWERIGFDRGSREISIPRCCSRPSIVCSRKRRTCCSARIGAPGTFSILATASCR